MNKNYKLITVKELKELSNFIEKTEPKNSKIFSKTKNSLKKSYQMMIDKNSKNK